MAFRNPDRPSDSAFLAMAGVEWPADLPEIDFSVPAGEADADAHAYLPGMGPDRRPAPHARVQPSRFAEVEYDDVLLSRIGMGEIGLGAEDGAAGPHGGTQGAYGVPQPLPLAADMTAEEHAAYDFVAMAEANFDEALLPVDFAAVEIMDPQPMDGSNSVKKLVRKHILPMGRIQHSGRVLNFSAEVLKNIARHSLAAFDQIPVTVATAKNEHNEDPFRFAGEVRNFTVVEDGPEDKRGLYADMALNQKGAELLDLNPRLGTSPRFLPNYVRQQDARRFGAVVRHVCATLDPHISGLGSWLEGQDSAGTAVAAGGVALTAMPDSAGGGLVADLTRAPWLKPATEPATPRAKEHRFGPPAGTPWAQMPSVNPSKGGSYRLVATDRTSTPHDFTKEVTRQMDPTDNPTGYEYDPVAQAALEAEEALANFDFSQLTGEQFKDIVLGLQTDLSVERINRRQDADTVAALTSSLTERDVDEELKDFARAGVRRSILYKAKGLLMSPAANEQVAVVDFTSTGENGQPQARQTAVGQLVREILNDCKGQVDMTGRPGAPGERGSQAATPAPGSGTPYDMARQQHESDYAELMNRIQGVAPGAVRQDQPAE